MKDALPASPFHIEHQFITGFVDTPLLGYITSGYDHSGNDLSILVDQVVNTADVSSGNDQIVDWGVGIDVFENDQMIVFIQEPGIGLTRADVAEKAILFHVHLLSNRCIYNLAFHGIR